jgi:hypothetical protein
MDSPLTPVPARIKLLSDRRCPLRSPLKTYRSTRDMLAEIKKLLAENRPSFHHSPLEEIAGLLCEGRHYSWVGIYLSLDEKSWIGRREVFAGGVKSKRPTEPNGLQGGTLIKPDLTGTPKSLIAFRLAVNNYPDRFDLGFERFNYCTFNNLCHRRSPQRLPDTRLDASEI